MLRPVNVGDKTDSSRNLSIRKLNFLICCREPLAPTEPLAAFAKFELQQAAGGFLRAYISIYLLQTVDYWQIPFSRESLELCLKKAKQNLHYLL